MKKRLFVAIELPASFRNQLAKYQLDSVKGLEIQPRLTVKENLHVTVSFLDTVEESFIPGLISELQTSSKVIQPFTLEYSGTILGPPGRFPFMIWAVFEKHTSFTNLIRVINRSVVEYLKKHKQPVFLSSHLEPVPHITLARFKKNVPPVQMSFTPFSIKELPVHSFTLMLSQLTRQGSIYTSIKSFPLSYQANNLCSNDSKHSNTKIILIKRRYES